MGMFRGKCMQRQERQKVSRLLRYSIIIGASVVFALGLLLWQSFSTGYYSSVSVDFGRYNYPFITANLQNRAITLAVDVGCRFPLALHQEMLDGIIDKQPQGTVTVHNIDGQKREAPSYLIPKLKIGELTLTNVVAHESQEEDYGTLGKFLGAEFNLLVDFPHSRIVACDSFAKLCAKELASKDWVSTPFEIYDSGIVFNARTDLGMLRLLINTTSTVSLLHSSFIPYGKPFTSSSLLLEGQQFGNVTFESMELPEGLGEVDGFIGMDFLNEHAVYFDYTHKIAYIEPSKKYFERIPVTFLKGDPTIDVSVEGRIYPAKLDLGSSIAFAFRNEILQNMRKFKYGTAVWHDFRGEKYESALYVVPEIRINNLKFVRALAKQDRDDFHDNVTMRGDPSRPIGVIGMPILEKYNLLLDFAHLSIYASSDRFALQDAGILSQSLLAIPFTSHPDGIILSVETDVGIHRLMLDTGATSIAIRAPHPSSTSRFSILQYDFGEQSVVPIDLSSQFEFDGFLGMDFLRKYPIFIDYSSKLVYIDLQQNNSQDDVTGL